MGTKQTLSQREPVGDPNDARGFEVLLQRYVEQLAVRGLAEGTQRNALTYLTNFSRWCVERGLQRPQDVSRLTVERYQRWLFHYRKKNGQPLGVSSQHAALQRIRVFFGWLAKERYVQYNPASELELPKIPPPLPVESYSIEEMEILLQTPDLETSIGLRDRAMLELMYSTGLRRTEVTQLVIYDVDFAKRLVVVRRGKGGRSRVVPCGARALAWSLKYLEDARPELVAHEAESAFFVSGEGLTFSPDGLGKRIAKILKASGVRRRHGGVCHILRHTMATQMLEGGADIRYIQEMLGHATLSTTQIYTRVSITKLQEIHAATHPAKMERVRGGELAAKEEI